MAIGPPFHFSRALRAAWDDHAGFPLGFLLMALLRWSGGLPPNASELPTVERPAERPGTALGTWRNDVPAACCGNGSGAAWDIHTFVVPVRGTRRAVEVVSAPYSALRSRPPHRIVLPGWPRA